MYASLIQFRLTEGTDWAAVRTLARQRARDYYQGLAGLHCKAFIVDPEQRIYGGFYVWTSRQALESFLQSEVFKSAKEKFGQPEIHVYEVAALVEQGQAVDPAEARPA